MSPAVTLVASCVIATVDRVEGPVAVLDWCGIVRTDAPLSALPDGVAEGTRVRLVRSPPARRLRPAASRADSAGRINRRGPSSPLQE
jgi:hypothetical protein